MHCKPLSIPLSSFRLFTLSLSLFFVSSMSLGVRKYACLFLVRLVNMSLCLVIAIVGPSRESKPTFVAVCKI